GRRRVSAGRPEVHERHRFVSGLRRRGPLSGGIPLLARPGHAGAQREGPDVPAGQARFALSSASGGAGPPDHANRSNPRDLRPLRGGSSRRPASVGSGKLTPGRAALDMAAELATPSLLSIRNDEAELSGMSRWFRDFAAESGIPADHAADLELGLQELR